jgi:C1A family cysteine protease
MLIDKRFTTKADKPDWRDRYYNFARTELRPYVDLRPWAGKVEDQLDLGSCTGQAVVAAYELLVNMNAPEKSTDLSRLFVYYNSRLLEGDVLSDKGAYIRDAIKAVRSYGICSENIWPYNVSQFTTKPTNECYTDARHRVIKNYYRVTILDDILDALNANHPVVSSMLVYSDFNKISNVKAKLSMPQTGEQYIGGHAITLVGYDLPNKLLLAKNSFGSDWGDNGYFWIPFDYAETQFMDNWIFDIFLR